MSRAVGARRVGIVPAAGHATRLQPLAGSKELVRVGGVPVIDYLLERMRRAECDEIRVVTRADKRDVADHARRAGAVVLKGEPADVAASLWLGTEGLAAEDVVLFGFPDTIWQPPEGFRPLVERVGAGCDLALGLFGTDEPERSDVVETDGRDRVTAIHVKPADPPSSVLWGCGAARVAVLRGLARVREPGHYFDELARTTFVAGVHLSDEWIDVGTPQALERAEGVVAGAA